MQNTETEINETLDALGQLQSQWDQCLAPTVEFDLEQFWSMPWSSCMPYSGDPVDSSLKSGYRRKNWPLSDSDSAEAAKTLRSAVNLPSNLLHDAMWSYVSPEQAEQVCQELDSLAQPVGLTDYKVLDKALSGGLRPGEPNFQMGSTVPAGVRLALMYDKPEPTLADAHRVDYEAAACFEIAMATPKESAALNEKMRQAYRRYIEIERHEKPFGVSLTPRSLSLQSDCQIHPDIKGDCLP